MGSQKENKMFKNQIFTYVFPMFTIEICKSNHTSLLSNNMNFKFMFTTVCDSFAFFLLLLPLLGIILEIQCHNRTFKKTHFFMFK